MSKKFKKDIVYQSIKFDIISGVFPVGSRLPNELDFARERQVSFLTMRAALKMLEEDGLILRVPRKGTFVRSNRSEELRQKPIRVLVLLPDLRRFDSGDLFNNELHQGIAEAAWLDGGTAVVENFDGLAALPRRYEAGEFDGVIWDRPDAAASATIEQLRGLGVPQLAINRIISGLPSLRTDYTAAIRQAMHFLRSIGHRHIGYIDIPNTSAPIVGRQQYFVNMLRADGIDRAEAHLIVQPMDNHTPDWQYIAERIQALPQLSALLVSNVRMSFFAEYLHYGTCRVPHDLSVIQFGENGNFNRELDQPYSILTDPRRRIGKQAFLAIRRLLRHESLAAEELVPGELIVRESCALPRNYIISTQPDGH